MGVGNTYVKDEPWDPTPPESLSTDPNHKYKTGDYLDCMVHFPGIALHPNTVTNFKIRPPGSCAQGYKKDYYTLQKKMLKVSHMHPDLTCLPSGSSSPKATMAPRRPLNFDQILPQPPENIVQSSAVPTVSLGPPNLPLCIFSKSALEGTAQAQVPLIPTTSSVVNSLTPPPSSQDPVIPTVICASALAVSQISPPSTAAQANNDTTVAQTNSSDSFINIDPPQAPAATCLSVTNHHSSLAIANANEVHNFRIEAHDTLEQLSTTTTGTTNNVQTVQTIDLIMDALSNQFQAQQLRVQREIQEQAQSTNMRFAALETCNIYIPNKTLRETEPALAFGRPPAHVKPKALSIDTLCNNKFSCNTPGQDEISPSAPQSCPLPTANPFGFSDYPPDNYYDHPQPQ
uniref:Uncharacterized protein n=1 Tax=Romanomermis culicivorax TaxID=13658 RepID=A0A915JFY6_ROMCU